MDKIFLDLLQLLAISSITSSLIIFIFSKFFSKIWVMDKPQKYWYKRKPVPYAMWVVFFVNFFILSAIAVKIWIIDFSQKILMLWLFWAIITTVSFIDDIWEVSPKLRLLMQIWIWAIMALTTVKIWYVSNIFGWILHLDQFNFELLWLHINIIPLFFTIFWYVLVFNSINWSDWIPWLTSGLTTISLFIILILSIKLFMIDKSILAKENSEFVIKLIAIILPTVFIFSLLDPKPRMLMWDSWTMFIAFIIATSAIIAGWKIATVATVIWVYLIDAFYVIITRMCHKKNPLKKDFSHLHHRLQKIWLSTRYIKIFIFSLTLLFWIFAIMLNNTIQKIMLFWILAWIIILISQIWNVRKTKISEENID